MDFWPSQDEEQITLLAKGVAMAIVLGTVMGSKSPSNPQNVLSCVTRSPVPLLSLNPSETCRILSRVFHCRCAPAGLNVLSLEAVMRHLACPGHSRTRLLAGFSDRFAQNCSSCGDPLHLEHGGVHPYSNPKMTRNHAEVSTSSIHNHQ